MSSIVSILIFGAVYLVVYVVKSLGATPGNDGGKPFGESFPSIEILEPERSEPVPAPTPTVVAPKRPAREPGPQRHSVQKPARVAAPSEPEKESPEPVRRERLVKFGSKSDAKRAFLYSEIFNRKY